MKRKSIFYSLLILLGMTIMYSSCQQKKQVYDAKVMHDPELYIQVMHKLNYVVIYDIFTPPVAARVFAYSNLAAYEVLSKEGKHLNSLEGKVNGLKDMPVPPKGEKIDYPFASIIAMTSVGKLLTFSDDTMQILIDSVKLLAKNSGMPDDMFSSSVNYGEQVANAIIAWSKKDNYAETRGSRFVLSNKEGHWTPTPPGYFDAVEPLWKTIRCAIVDSPDVFPPQGLPPFSKDSTSAFYKLAKEVMVTGKTLDDNQKWIANFWDCNSFKLHVSGHAMYATKAMTPVGHWMEIVGTVSKNNNADFYKTVYAYTCSSLGIYDGFICCWLTKYNTDVIRPETYINRYIDADWVPYLQTPPFPEYNSAHSTISAACATVLGTIYTNTAFKDSTEREWGWPDRSFKNTDDAAMEVSYSRFYGGIHYRQSVMDAYKQGKQIGQLVMERLSMKENKLD